MGMHAWRTTWWAAAPHVRGWSAFGATWLDGESLIVFLFGRCGFCANLAGVHWRRQRFIIVDTQLTRHAAGLPSTGLSLGRLLEPGPAAGGKIGPATIPRPLSILSGSSSSCARTRIPNQQVHICEAPVETRSAPT